MRITSEEITSLDQTLSFLSDVERAKIEPILGNLDKNDKRSLWHAFLYASTVAHEGIPQTDMAPEYPSTGAYDPVKALIIGQSELWKWKVALKSQFPEFSVKDLESTIAELANYLKTHAIGYLHFNYKSNDRKLHDGSQPLQDIMHIMGLYFDGFEATRVSAIKYRYGSSS